MNDSCLREIRNIDNFNNAIIKSVVLDSNTGNAEINIITDKCFTDADKGKVFEIVRKYVPERFGCVAKISKLSPDAQMVKDKIFEIINASYKSLSVTLSPDDITVEKTEKGFSFRLRVASGYSGGDICATVCNSLQHSFCGEFFGECVEGGKSVANIEVEEEQEDFEYEMPARYFKISGYSLLEGTEKHKTAVYMSDLNFEGDNIVICGTIEDIREKNYTTSKGVEKIYYNYTLSDGTASMRVTYFPRVKSLDKIRAIKVGDSIVCIGKSEQYNSYLRYTADIIDMGKVPHGFVPEKRPSKPVPRLYKTVKPKPFSDISQTDMFTAVKTPTCLKDKTFVVLDLETTGLNSTPSTGTMDSIIEIGAFKIINGEICESFSTFLNPKKKLPEEIVGLTGITDEMLSGAPFYEDVMPDFYKFCQGNILVGHNIVNFDFKFIDYYCSKLGYILDRKLIDTVTLAQENLYLSNYKLNTIADHFKITFNHHRAIDDAYVTAKIFLELIKLKKSLPKLQ